MTYYALVSILEIILFKNSEIFLNKKLNPKEFVKTFFYF